MKLSNPLKICAGISLLCIVGGLVTPTGMKVKETIKKTKLERLLNKGKVIPVPYSDYMVIQYGKSVYELYKPVGSKYIREEVGEFQ